jgi:serine/threonine protein kinase
LEILEYLHTQNPPIIYRDLKPSNIMLTPDGRIVLIDFGIARLLMPQQPATKVVSEGYSPPEQYAGKPEPASDLYALGCTLSQLLTGVRPRPLSVCSPAQHNADILSELDAICQQLTASDPRERPSSAREVRLALYRIYLKANPETEISADLLKGVPLRKPGQSKHIVNHNASLSNTKPLHQIAASGFTAAIDSVLHARQYFQQIWHKRSARSFR